MFARVCLVHYHEIGLKGRNRSTFERRLQENLEAALVSHPVGRVERIASRLAVPVRDESVTPAVAARIALVPGVAAVSSAYVTGRDPALMERAALQALSDAGGSGSFRVESRRSNTDFTEPTMAMNRRIGAVLQAATGRRVDLGSPDVTVNVLVVQGATYVFAEQVRGIGGLPVGSAGRVVALLSAGIDSPVAAWRMMRRGATVVGVHFSGRPAIADSSERLVAEIGSVLERTGGLGRIYVVPFGELQREISLAVPPDLRVLIYRRLMIRIAEAVAVPERGRALVTGESLGQVASQTLENIVAVDEAATLPVLRPLIGHDKVEIIEDAEALGTFGISIQPHGDCCTLFLPRNPATHATPAEVREAWGLIDHERMVRDALESLEWLDFRCPAYRPPGRWPTPTGSPGSSARSAAAAKAARS